MEKTEVDCVHPCYFKILLKSAVQSVACLSSNGTNSRFAGRVSKRMSDASPPVEKHLCFYGFNNQQLKHPEFHVNTVAEPGTSWSVALNNVHNAKSSKHSKTVHLTNHNAFTCICNLSFKCYGLSNSCNRSCAFNPFD